MGLSNDELVDAIDDVLRSTLSVVRDLSEDDADRPTECPGWTVRDQLAHVVGLEQVLAGAPPPVVDLPPLDHVRSDIDRFMEGPVHVRRGLPLCAIADELAGFRSRRLTQLRDLVAEGDPMVPGPFGERALSASLPIRAFDLWMHEQDIRRAVGLPVRAECAAARISAERSLLGWSTGLASRVEGVHAELSVELTGPEAARTHVVIGDGGPTATLRADVGDLTRVFGGRAVPGPELLDGDAAVVAALRDRLAMTP